MKIASLLFFSVLISQLGQAQQLLWEANVNPANFRTNGVQFSKDGSEILAGTDCHPAKIRRFDTKDGTITWDYTLSDGLMCVMGIGINASEKYVAAIEEFGNLLIFDYTLETPELVNSIELGSEYAFGTAFSPDAKHVAAVGTQGKLFIANAETGKVLHDIEAHGDWVLCVDYNAQGTFLATGANDRRVKVWDTTGQLVHTLIGHKGNVSSIRFSKDGTHLYSSSADGTLIKWDVEKEEAVWTLDVSDKELYDFALSPDENFVAVVAKDKTLSLWNLASRVKLSSYALPGKGAKTVDWSPTEKKVCVGTEQGNLLLFDISSPLSAPQALGPDEYVSLFPSPIATNSQLNYRFQEGTSVSLNIYRIDGNLVHNHEHLPNEGTLPLGEDWQSGLYVLEFSMGSGSFYREVFSKL